MQRGVILLPFQLEESRDDELRQRISARQSNTHEGDQQINSLDILPEGYDKRQFPPQISEGRANVHKTIIGQLSF